MDPKTLCCYRLLPSLQDCPRTDESLTWLAVLTAVVGAGLASLAAGWDACSQ